MHARSILPTIAWLALLTGTVAAERDHEVTIDDYFSLASVEQFAISPGGEYVAYGESRWQQSTDDRRADYGSCRPETSRKRGG